MYITNRSRVNLRPGIPVILSGERYPIGPWFLVCRESLLRWLTRAYPPAVDGNCQQLYTDSRPVPPAYLAPARGPAGL